MDSDARGAPCGHYPVGDLPGAVAPSVGGRDGCAPAVACGRRRSRSPLIGVAAQTCGGFSVPASPSRRQPARRWRYPVVPRRPCPLSVRRTTATACAASVQRGERAGGCCGCERTSHQRGACVASGGRGPAHAATGLVPHVPVFWGGSGVFAGSGGRAPEAIGRVIPSKKIRLKIDPCLRHLVPLEPLWPATVSHPTKLARRKGASDSQRPTGSTSPTGRAPAPPLVLSP